jgi:hypothetical protein
MSQELTPVPNSQGVVGLSPQLTTTFSDTGPKYASRQYKEAKELRVQPTQWNPLGRPIYYRLPAASEQYQVEFFADGGKGYVLVPSGGDQFGPGSIYVGVNETLDVLLIENGAIVWEEGTTPVYRTVVDFREIGLEDGRYLVCYQLLYDDEPEPLPFLVSDYSLAGLDFSVQDSGSASFNNVGTDFQDPWPFPGSYAFLPNSRKLEWKNYVEVVNRQPQASSGTKPGIPSYDQPLLSYLEWSSPLPWKLDTIRIRTSLVENVPPCTYYVGVGNPDDPWEIVQIQEAKKDSEGYYWEFLTDMTPQTKWRMQWPDFSKVNAYGITVSGTLYVETRPTTARARSQLAIYPTNLVPKDESFCRLAIISVDNFKLTRKPNGQLWNDDVREITTRDYQPIADWLTVFWDKQLIKLWEKIKGFSPIFMAPPTLLKDSYFDLEAFGLDVSSDTPPLPPPPPLPSLTQLVSASVALIPLYPAEPSFTGATVTLTPAPGSPAITDMTVTITP